MCPVNAGDRRYGSNLFQGRHNLQCHYRLLYYIFFYAKNVISDSHSISDDSVVLCKQIVGNPEYS